MIPTDDDNDEEDEEVDDFIEGFLEPHDMVADQIRSMAASMREEGFRFSDIIRGVTLALYEITIEQQDHSAEI